MAFKLENNRTESSKEEFSIDKILKTEINWFGSKFSNKKKFSFYFELSVLLNAGITIKEAITLLLENQKKEVDKQLFETILKAFSSDDVVST